LKLSYADSIPENSIIESEWSQKLCEARDAYSDKALPEKDRLAKSRLLYEKSVDIAKQYHGRKTAMVGTSLLHLAQTYQEEWEASALADSQANHRAIIFYDSGLAILDDYLHSIEGDSSKEVIFLCSMAENKLTKCLLGFYYLASGKERPAIYSRLQNIFAEDKISDQKMRKDFAEINNNFSKQKRHDDEQAIVPTKDSPKNDQW